MDRRPGAQRGPPFPSDPVGLGTSLVLIQGEAAPVPAALQRGGSWAGHHGESPGLTVQASRSADCPPFPGPSESQGPIVTHSVLEDMDSGCLLEVVAHGQNSCFALPVLLKPSAQGHL